MIRNQSNLLSNRKRNSFPVLLLPVLLTALVLFIFNKELILHPNSFLIGSSGDAIKSYFSTIGLIDQNSSLHQFNLMNYPYGQTHLFTDGQTGIAWIICGLSKISPWFSLHTIGIINSFYFLNWILCALFLFLILNRFNLPASFSVPGSVAITILSPQIFRVVGHPTLCYVAFFPFAWWLLIKFRESRYKPVYFLIILLNSCFWNFVHPYYLPAIIFFYLLVWIIGFLQKKISGKEFLLWGLPMVLLPLIISQLYLSVYDIHTNRSAYPYGFWDYTATFTSVFAPTHAPFAEAFKYFFNGAKGQHWEGWAYIGLPCVLIAVFYIVKIIRYLFKKNFHSITHPVYPEILSVAFWPAILLLAYSMSFPFNAGLGFLYDWLAPLRQFRSLGRFAWIFYYVFTVFALYTFYLISRFLKMKKLTLLANSMYILFFSLIIGEGIANHIDVSSTAGKNPNIFLLSGLNDEQKELISKAAENKNNCQALITIPFYHVGSENFSKEFSDYSITSSMILSYWTQLPLVNSSAARSPITEARNIMQLPGPSYIKKDIERDLRSEKDFLVLYTREQINPTEQDFLSRCKLISESEHYQLLSISYKDLFDPSSATAKDSSGFLLSRYADVYVKGDSSYFIFNNFENKTAEKVFEGKGALEGTKSRSDVLIDHVQMNVPKETEFVCSFWYYNVGELRLQTNCIVEESDKDGQNGAWIKEFSPAQSMIIDGEWSLAEVEFKTTKDNPLITVFMKGDSKSDQKIYIDNFILRRKNTHSYRLHQTGNAIRKISFDNLPLR